MWERIHTFVLSFVIQNFRYMKKANDISYLNNARNGEHYQLYSSLLNLVTEELAEKYGLTTYRSRFATAFAKENKVYVGNQGYIQTESVLEKSTATNLRFRALDLAIQSKQLSLEADEAAAAKRLVFEIKKYRKAAQKSQTDQIAMMKDLVDTFETEYTEDMATAGVTDLLNDLKTAVTDFETVLYERADEQMARSEMETMKSIRPKVESAFDDLANLITALYLVAAYIDNDSEKATELETLIDAINTRILHFQSTLSRRGVGTTEKGSEEETDPEEPETITPEITAVYQKEGGDPENPLLLQRGEQIALKYKGFTLKGQDGTLEHVIGLINDQDYTEWIKPETITNVTETSCEFTMVDDLTEGKYTIHIETYDGGNPLVVEYPEMITLV